MLTRFLVKHTIADITDFEFLLFGYLIEGKMAPGMFVRLRPQQRIHPDYRLHAVEIWDWFPEDEGKPYYGLTIQCSDLAETDALHALRLRDEEVEIRALPD